jgi:hypothetical protein
MNQYRKTFVDLLIGLVVGLATSIITKNLALASAIGLLTFFLTEFIDLKAKLLKHSEQLERLNEMWLGFLKPGDTVSELAYEYGFKQATNIANDQIHVSSDQVWTFWRTCLLKTKTRWVVISYVDPDTWWNLGTVKPTLVTQEERIKWGCHIERIFCIDAENEIENLKDTIKEQSKIGIEVGVITKKKLLENKLIAQYIHDIGTLDIALVDDKYVYRTHIDKNRKIESG